MNHAGFCVVMHAARPSDPSRATETNAEYWAELQCCTLPWQQSQANGCLENLPTLMNAWALKISRPCMSARVRCSTGRSGAADSPRRLSCSSSTCSRAPEHHQVLRLCREPPGSLPASPSWLPDKAGDLQADAARLDVAGSASASGKSHILPGCAPKSLCPEVRKS